MYVCVCVYVLKYIPLNVAFEKFIYGVIKSHDFLIQNENSPLLSLLQYERCKEIKYCITLVLSISFLAWMQIIENKSLYQSGHK